MIFKPKHLICKRLRSFYLLRTLLFLLLLHFSYEGLFAQQHTVFHLPEGQKSVEIPFENHNNLIIVPVVINNTLETKFILDSGANGTVLIEKLIADLLGMSYSREITVAGAGGMGIIRAFQADSVDITIKGVNAKPSEVIVLAQDYLSLKEYLGIEVQGIIGASVFRDLVVEIDYDDYELVLHDPEQFNPPKKFKSYDIELRNNKPYIRGLVQQKGRTPVEADFLIDLGASHAMLLEIDSAGTFVVPQENLSTSLGRGLSGDISGNLGRVPSFTLGDFELNNVITSFTPLYSKIQLHGRVGTIGGELFSRFHVFVSFPDEKIYLKKNKKFNDPFQYNMSGMELIAFGNDYDRIKVAGVYEGSPADKAGVKEGDELLKINWIHVKYFSLSHINAILRSREGKKMRLKVLRDGEKHKIKFRLKKLI